MSYWHQVPPEEYLGMRWRPTWRQIALFATIDAAIAVWLMAGGC